VGAYDENRGRFVGKSQWGGKKKNVESLHFAQADWGGGSKKGQAFRREREERLGRARKLSIGVSGQHLKSALPAEKSIIYRKLAEGDIHRDPERRRWEKTTWGRYWVGSQIRGMEVEESALGPWEKKSGLGVVEGRISRPHH